MPGAHSVLRRILTRMSATGRSAKVAYAQRLVRDGDSLARAQLDAVQTQMPDMGDPDLAALALASAVATLEAFAAVIEHGIDVNASPPAVTLAYVRRLVWSDITIDVLARAYRLGHEWLHEDLRAFCAAHCASDHDAVELLGELDQLAFRFTDLATTAVIAEYQREREALLRNDLAQRHSLVRAILDDRPIDIATTERALSYRFDARHTAIRAWISRAERGTDSRALGDAMTAVTRAIAAASPPLIVQDGPALLTAWVHRELDSTALAQVSGALREHPVVRVAAGTTRSGLTGFRRTYQQAERARIVGPTGHARFVAYHDVSLVALLLENPDAARAYVHEELGALAADNPNVAVLRDTLLTFLECQCRHLPAADALHVHRNTVAQRVARAEHILRRPTTQRPTELETALRLQQHFDRGTSDPMG
jgi:DNA-binding PucR family transcriptional regulator